MPKLCKLVLVHCFFVVVKLFFEEYNVVLAELKCRLLRFREIVIVITQIFLLGITCIVGTSTVFASFVTLDAAFGWVFFLCGNVCDI